MSYYIIRMLGAVGLVWDIREPTEKALNSNLMEQECSNSVSVEKVGAENDAQAGIV